MLALGLDPSLTGFGWCLHNSSEIGPKRVVARGRFSTSPKAIFVQRYIDLRNSVGEVLDAYSGIEAVGVESPPFGEQYSEGLYALFLMVNEAIYVRRKDVVYFDPGTLKMLVKEDPDVRKGKMFKADMVAAAKADTGITGKFNHNEADAYHIGRFAARFFEFVRGTITEADLSPAEHRSFARVHTFTRGKKKGETVQMGAAYKEGQRFFKFSELP